MDNNESLKTTGAEPVEADNGAKPVPSYVRVLLSPRSASASVIVMPPVGGGAEMTLEKLSEALADAGVCHGINQAELENIINNKYYDIEFDVAKYTPPVNGENGSITYLFDCAPTALLLEKEDGTVNYRELGLFRSVLKDTVIAEITPPTEGVPGKDVLGRDIAPKPAKKAAFTIGVGTVLTDDGLKIIAATDGVINYENSAFVVRQDLNIKADIDFNTGNIKFMGNISVHGNVGEGFKVESTGGNVSIFGAVFSGAEIIAAGDVTLKQVCNHTKIKAGGNINATFCEYCNLSANGDINAQTLLVSTVYCGGKLNLKGGLIGGRYVILSGAMINGNVGAAHYPQTEILLGNNTILAEERDRLSVEIARMEDEIVDLNMIVDYLNAKKRDEHTITSEKEQLLGSSVRSRIRKNRAIGVAKKRIEEIDHLLENVEDLRMAVGGTVFDKTRFCINSAKHQVRNECKRVTIYVDKENTFHFDNM